eukprot:scaffold33323_cov68-Phaeocystis_antarctica.AAC.4
MRSAHIQSALIGCEPPRGTRVVPCGACDQWVLWVLCIFSPHPRDRQGVFCIAQPWSYARVGVHGHAVSPSATSARRACAPPAPRAVASRRRERADAEVAALELGGELGGAG